MKIALLDLAILYRYLEAQRSADAIDGPTLQLRFYRIGMNRKPAIDRRDDPINRKITVVAHSHFNRVRRISAKREMRCDTDAAALRAFTAVIDALGNKLGEARQATGIEGWSAVVAILEFALVAKQVYAELDRVLSGFVRDLVDEALYDERVRCVPWRSP